MDTLIFRESAPELEEKEVLAHIIQFTQRKIDAETIANSLLENFGSLKNVFEAEPVALKNVSGVSTKTANCIASFLPIVRKYELLNSNKEKQISNRLDLAEYCKSILMGKRIEEFWIICVNAQCKVIGKRRIATGSLSEVSAYPRLVMETALNYNAHSVFFAHNHPGGTCGPSAEDIRTTEQLKKLLNGVGINVLDHMIVAGANTYSMAQHGDIAYA